VPRREPAASAYRRRYACCAVTSPPIKPCGIVLNLDCSVKGGLLNKTLAPARSNSRIDSSTAVCARSKSERVITPRSNNVVMRVSSFLSALAVAWARSREAWASLRLASVPIRVWATVAHRTSTAASAIVMAVQETEGDSAGSLQVRCCSRSIFCAGYCSVGEHVAL
jgi:hypothetical protein